MNILKSAETALFMAASVDFSFVEANTHTHLPLVSRFSEPTELMTTNTNKRRTLPSDLTEGSSLKDGGLLLSRIALQYHRRRRA